MIQITIEGVTIEIPPDGYIELDADVEAFISDTTFIAQN